MLPSIKQAAAITVRNKVASFCRRERRKGRNFHLGAQSPRLFATGKAFYSFR
jgi:hypothetical protein